MKKRSAVVIGLAFFSMFFGSGNLIFPLSIGMSSKSSFLSAIMGFLTTGVFLPFLGALVMVLFKGSYSNFFSCLGKRVGFLLSAFLLTVWIPLGTAPRCIALSYASMEAYTNVPSIFLISGIDSFLVFIVIYRKSAILDILGKIITPLLLICLAAIVIKGIFFSDAQISNDLQNSFFTKGVLSGYNTMDLIASFFFSASVISMLNKSSSKSPLKMMVKSSIIGMSVLASVYMLLIFLAAKNSYFLEGVAKEKMLAHLAGILLGGRLQILAVLAIVLACFSTSVALITTYSDFLENEVFKGKKKANLSIVISLVISYVMSLFGLKGITFVTSPILKICYPILIGLIVVNLFKIAFNNREKKVLDFMKSDVS